MGRRTQEGTETRRGDLRGGFSKILKDARQPSKDRRREKG